MVNKLSKLKYFDLPSWLQPLRLMLRAWHFIAFALISCLNIQGIGQETSSFRLTELGIQELVLNDSLRMYIDHNRGHSIQTILSAPPDVFQLAKVVNVPPLPFVAWSRITVTNESENPMHGFFAMHRYIDTVQYYPIYNGRAIGETLSGAKINPDNKLLFSNYNFLPYSLEPQETRTYYFRMVVTKEVYHKPFYYLSTIDANLRAKKELSKYFIQYSFSGIMLTFSLLSLFMFGMFKEKAFLYFAFITLNFIIFFLHQNWVFGTLFSYHSEWRDEYIPQIASSFTNIFIYLFVAEHIKLHKFYPSLNRFYLAITILTATIIFPIWEMGVDLGMSRTYHRYLSLFWVFTTFGILIYLVIKKNKSARILLISGGILIIGAVLDTLSMMGLIPATFWTFRNSLQMGVVVFSGTLFYSLFIKFNDIRIQAQQLEERNELKNKFFTNISHEFRTPLTLMLGPIEQLLEKTQDSTDKTLLGIAHRNAKRQLRLVNQLLDLSKLEAGEMKLQASENNFSRFLRGIVYAYESSAQQRNIDIEVDTPKRDVTLWFDREKMEKICYNILTNAFKFTPSGGQVSVKLAKQKNMAHLQISDTGQGIPAEHLESVFDRFFQVDAGKNDMQVGSGIGLPLVKELVELHRGTIRLESIVGKGTTVHIYFPLGKAHLKEEAIILDPEIIPDTPEISTLEIPESSTQSLTAKPLPNKTPRILIVEDNDDVRAFIRQRLAHAYRIIEAIDGEAGLTMALDKMPDLIISDVMMPKSNGYELCRAIKSDVRTSHIPVILLTAKSPPEEKHTGLESGADDFITKPFDSKELNLRVNNLIQNRRKFLSGITPSLSLKPSELATNSVDQNFLTQALEIVEANLADENFNIDHLSRELGMSRPNLNRKFRALLDQSTNQFIQSIRLQRAADMLRQNTGSVSEIAFQTGFSSAAYFVKCFKQQYGETPGNFVKNQ